MEETAFQQAVVEQPDDVALRLVFADWLEERGDPRGTFIRLQCRRAELTRHDPAWKELLAQEAALLRQYETAWSKPILRLVDGVEFHRGFIEHVTTSAAKFLKNADRLFRLAPIRSVQLKLVGSLMPAIADCPHLTRVQTLNLGHNSLGRRALETLLHSPHLKLTALRLFGCELGPGHAEALGTAPSLASLQALELGSNMLGEDGAQALAAAPHLGQLRELRLQSNHVFARGTMALVSNAPFRLAHLELGSNQVGNEGATAIADSPHGDELRRLILDHNGISNIGAVALARSPHLTQLEHLDLLANSISDFGVKALAESRSLAQLTFLNLERNEYSSAAARSLSACASFPRMRHLVLSQR